MTGKVSVIGLGPGSLDLLSPLSLFALESADVIMGYTTYLDLIKDLVPDIPRLRSGMRGEVQRAKQSLEIALQGMHVVLVSGGDPGIYGMAGLVFELKEEMRANVEIQVLPGISALNAAAALLGAPLMTDFCAISLSDQLLPLDEIAGRLEAAAKSDFIITLYNPKSRLRVQPFELANEILLKWRPPSTLVGIVHQAFRSRQKEEIIRLEELIHAAVDMQSLIIIGNQNTELMEGKMVTRRGYQRKYGELKNRDQDS